MMEVASRALQNGERRLDALDLVKVRVRARVRVRVRVRVRISSTSSRRASTSLASP